MAEEHVVIACHNAQAWKQRFDQGLESKKLVVVDFTASWCGPCRMITPILCDLAKMYPNVTFLKVDVDELQAVAEEWKVEAMPTLVFLKEGQEVDRIVGARKDELYSKVEKHAAIAAGGNACSS